MSIFQRAAEEQGGLLVGKDPTRVDTSDPIRLWTIQLGIIILTTQLLALVLAKLRQPKVIAEVLCGIVLGPTIMGRVPHFTEHIFPLESRSYLNLTATIGLVLFLFLVGLEIDVRVIQRNARSSGIISLGAIFLPLGIGFGMAVPIYNVFIDHQASTFAHFALFVAVAYSELKLLDTTIGVVVLSAGVGNDIVGWTLLALTIALVNAGSGITALYILLTAIAWTLFMLIPVKRALLWLARWTGSVENGPTTLMMTVAILTMFGSAFFTDAIGVHAIFGAFLAGLAIPHDGGLAIALTEKLEDLTSLIFLPLYFTLSGLSTDLGLLNDGITWGYTIAIIVTAYFGKAVGGTFGARAAGFTWRESKTVGTLLSCKGLVELIVLNIGLNAKILDTKVFSMFVLEALTLTFMTTPVTIYLYPPHLRTRVNLADNNTTIEDGRGKNSQATAKRDIPSRDDIHTRFTVVLDKIEHLSAIMTISRFLQSSAPQGASSQGPSSQSITPKSDESTTSSPTIDSCVSVDALRLIELSDRTSAMMKSTVVDELIQTDSLLSVYQTFGALNDLPVSASMAIVSQDSFATSVSEHANRNESDMIIMSWLAPRTKAVAEPVGSGSQTPAAETTAMGNPFEGIFNANPVQGDTMPMQFVRKVFSLATTDVGCFIVGTGRHSNPGLLNRAGQHIVLPFFGGPDDRLALSFVVQLCSHPNVTATIIRARAVEAQSVSSPMAARVTSGDSGMRGPAHGESLSAAVRSLQQLAGAQSPQHSIIPGTFPDTIYANPTTQTRLESDTADNIAWESASSPNQLTPAHSRMSFTEQATPLPLHSLIERIEAEDSHRRLLVVVGRGRRLAVQSHRDELKIILARQQGIGGDVRKTVGDVATGILAGYSNPVSLLVLQASEQTLTHS